MKLRVVMTAAMLFNPWVAQATVADDIAALELAKAERGTPLLNLGMPGAQPSLPTATKPPRMMTLTDGRPVNLNDYAIVVFMQRGCQYSAKFDPALKAWTDQQGIKVYPYTLDGYGDSSFPVALIPRKTGPGEPIAGEILTFFGNGLPIATPTTFVVNVNTNTAYPLYQGDTDMNTISQRFVLMLEADMDNRSPDTLGPVPANTSLTPN